MIQVAGIFTLYGKLEVKIKKILLVLVVFVFLFRFWQTTGCRQFQNYKFIPLSVKIMVEDQTNIDSATANSTTKFFHNKLSIGFYQLTLAFERTLDLRLLLAFFGPVGLFLAILSLSRVREKKVELNFVLISGASLLILFSNFKYSIFALMVSWQILALTGISYLANKNLKILVFVLTILTLWYFSIDWKMFSICNDIKFN